MQMRSSLCCKMLLTVLLALAWAADGHANGTYGTQVDGFCPSKPYASYVGADHCMLCHLSDKAASTPAKTAFLRGDLCYFCPEDPPCVPNPVCTDADGDGYFVEGGACGDVDCDDADAAVNPGVPEIPGNGIDDDCKPNTPPWGTPLSTVDIGPRDKTLSDILNYVLVLLGPVGLLLFWKGPRRKR